MAAEWTVEIDDDLYTLYRFGEVFYQTDHDAVGWDGAQMLMGIARTLNDEEVR